PSLRIALHFPGCYTHLCNKDKRGQSRGSADFFGKHGMTLLQQAAQLICEHLCAQHHATEIRMCLHFSWQDLLPHVEEIKQMMAAGKWPQEWGNIESQAAMFPEPQVPEGHMRWWEERWYPPPDMLLRLREGLPIGPQGALGVVLEQAGQQLLVMIP